MNLVITKKYINLKTKGMSKAKASSFKEGALYALYVLVNSEHIKHLEDVLEIIYKVTNLKIDSLKSKLKTRKIVEARYLYFYISKKNYSEVSYKNIGILINRDHDNVIYGIKVINDLKNNDYRIMNLINEIEYRLQNVN